MSFITAHSGCDGTQDNSLAFIQYALNSNADCMEVDVRTDQMGNLILSHDEAGDNCVKLREVFALLKHSPDKKINCDLKVKDLEFPVYQLARKYQIEDQLIYTGEVSLKQLDEKEKDFPKAEIYLNIENLHPSIYKEISETGSLEKLKDLLIKSQTLSIAGINMEYHLFTDEILSLLRQLGLKESAWTVDESEDLRRLLSKNLANITTRNLKEALDIKEDMKR